MLISYNYLKKEWKLRNKKYILKLNKNICNFYFIFRGSLQTKSIVGEAFKKRK